MRSLFIGKRLMLYRLLAGFVRKMRMCFASYLLQGNQAQVITANFELAAGMITLLTADRPFNVLVLDLLHACGIVHGYWRP